MQNRRAGNLLINSPDLLASAFSLRATHSCRDLLVKVSARVFSLTLEFLVCVIMLFSLFSTLTNTRATVYCLRSNTSNTRYFSYVRLSLLTIIPISFGTVCFFVSYAACMSFATSISNVSFEILQLKFLTSIHTIRFGTVYVIFQPRDHLNQTNVPFIVSATQQTLCSNASLIKMINLDLNYQYLKLYPLQ